MTEPTNMRRDAIAALLNNPDHDFSLAVSSINRLVDPENGLQIQQIITFVADVLLQMPSARFREVMLDGQEGLGVILAVCAEALEAQEDFKEAQHMEGYNVTKLEVSDE